jgi:acyl-CoA synthetase (AMP-forming)/AMP-acid ligase II
MLLIERIWNHVKSTPSRTAVFDGFVTLSFKDLWNRAEELDDKIHSQIVCSDPQLNCESVVTIISALRQSRALCLAPQSQMISAFGRNWESMVHPKAKLILLTSGSKGVPKAVQLSSENLDASLSALIESIPFAEFSAQILSLPLSYSFGLLGQLFPALASGTCTRLCNSLLKVKDILHSSQPHQELGSAVLLSGVPKHAEFFVSLFDLNPDLLTRVSGVVIAGGHLNFTLRQRLKVQCSHFLEKLWIGYGQTEAASRILMLNATHVGFDAAACGKAIQGFEVKCDPEGQLLCRGPAVMLGYLGEDPRGSESWWNTGDCGFLDSNGDFSFRERQDDLVKVCGLKVSLESLKRTVFEHEIASECFLECVGESLNLFYVGDEGAKKKLKLILAKLYPIEVVNAIQIKPVPELSFNARGKPISKQNAGETRV